jgi:LysR family transcriptional regulator, benzoate and cis,cis-muconate-responsive activator of ben and cat genes
MLRRARLLLAEADHALEEVRLTARGLSGRLTVAFAGSGINGSLGKALGRVRRELPEIELRLEESFDDREMSTGVIDGRIDIAVQRLPVRDARLTTRIWIREPLSLYLPTGHPAATGREPVALSVLGAIPLVMWPRAASPRSYDEVIALCHRAGVVPTIATEGRTVQTILALVAAGFGAAVMADSYRVLHREGVTPMRLADTSTSLHLVSAAGNTSPLLARFLDILGNRQ